MSFEMQVLNIFRLSNGRTVLGGLIRGESGLIGSCRCQLRSGDEARQTLTIENEQIVKKADPGNKLRALATLEDIDLTEEEARSGEWKLVPID